MDLFFQDFPANRAAFAKLLRVKESFDVMERRIRVGEDEAAFFFVDGLVKDGDLQKLLQAFLSRSALGDVDTVVSTCPQVEIDRIYTPSALATAVLSGQVAMLSSHFHTAALALDLRTYPGRDVAEPDSDRVMQGARDGFVETLITNTALIRRRIRDPRLIMKHVSLGGISATDVVVCYMDGIADKDTVACLLRKIQSVRPASLTLGTQSLVESLIGRGWFNPFPKIRTTERPDTAAAQVVEGSVLILCDTSPLVLMLPTSIFDYLQQTDDYYFPPVTGTYLRIIRTLILLLSVVCTPLWYLALQHVDLLPPALSFLIPQKPGAIPILIQLFLAEIAIDGLKIASMNTPDMLSNSLSVVGALLLGDFAVDVGWFCEDVILYMAFVAIANFAQQNHELGHAFKFMRMLILGLTAALGGAGFLLGCGVFVLLVLTNRTLLPRRHYLYPLVPFDGKALLRLLFRLKKTDVVRVDPAQAPFSDENFAENSCKSEKNAKNPIDKRP